MSSFACWVGHGKRSYQKIISQDGHGRAAPDAGACGTHAFTLAIGDLRTAARRPMDSFRRTGARAAIPTASGRRGDSHGEHHGDWAGEAAPGDSVIAMWYEARAAPVPRRHGQRDGRGRPDQAPWSAASARSDARRDQWAVSCAGVASHPQIRSQSPEVRTVSLLFDLMHQSREVKNFRLAVTGKVRQPHNVPLQLKSDTCAHPGARLLAALSGDRSRKLGNDCFPRRMEALPARLGQRSLVW